MPTVASRISARYSPTCVVKLDSMEISMVKIVSTSSATLTSCVSGSTTSIPRQRVRVLGHDQHPNHGRQRSPRTATMPPMTKRKRTSMPAHRSQVDRQHRQRGEDHDRFRRGELEQFEVVHGTPPFRSQSNSGESKLGMITSSSSRG